MRTTMTVDDDLLLQAKQRAAESGVSVSDIINSALRRGLAEVPTPRVAETGTITYGTATTVGPDDVALRAWQKKLDDELNHDQLGL
jgi:hypothetical protein